MIKQICTKLFALAGWTFENHLPDDLRSFVMIGAPHTSNFDFIPAMAASLRMKRNARFVIKSEWMKFPLNHFFAPLGAIGLDRKAIQEKKLSSTTDLMASLFQEHKELVIMISPEGTRSPNDHWKTGFYYIAQKAGVPIVCGHVDYAKKQACVGELIIYPTDFEKDMKSIMDYYRGKQGKKPENFRLDQRFEH